MIEYIIDKDEKYTEDILYHLREHNNSFTGDYVKKTYHMYCVENDVLIGGLTASSVWDWVSIGDLFYQNMDVLESMISVLIDRIKDTSCGIKLVTEVKHRQRDFLKIGFKDAGLVKVTKTQTWYYADLINLQTKMDALYEVNISEEIISVYDEILKNKTSEFNKKNHIPEMIEFYNVVAIHGSDFYGGALIEVYKDHIYTNLLAVNKSFRGNRVGSNLMNLIEKIATDHKRLYLSVGTAEFQAKPFYESLGYNVVHTRNNHPKGYHSYTLVKYIKTY